MTIVNCETGECGGEIIEIREKAGRVISTITHDLKSPMIAITGFAAILKEEMMETETN
jgi:signal transduction histidine kinase